MKKNSLTKMAIGVSVATAFALSVIPVFAQTSESASPTPGVTTNMMKFGNGGGRGRMMGSTTSGRMMSSTTRAENMQERISRIQGNGGKDVDNRIQSLQSLVTRIQGLKNVSDTEKTALENDLQTEITNLTNIKSRMSADSSTTTLRADIQSTIGGSRIYALVIPKTNILAAADRVSTIVGMMNTVATKLQTRLTNATSTSDTTTAQSALADFNAKVSDANTQASAAAAEVIPLVPDNGDKTKLASNIATLKDARTKIQAAGKDLIAAREDIKNILKVVSNK